VTKSTKLAGAIGIAVVALLLAAAVLVFINFYNTMAARYTAAITSILITLP
jgi:hypothetical protein